MPPLPQESEITVQGTKIFVLDFLSSPPKAIPPTNGDGAVFPDPNLSVPAPEPPIPTPLVVAPPILYPEPSALTPLTSVNAEDPEAAAFLAELESILGADEAHKLYQVHHDPVQDQTDVAFQPTIASQSAQHLPPLPTASAQYSPPLPTAQATAQEAQNPPSNRPEPAAENPDGFKPKTKKGRFPFERQMDEMDCGPTCLRMVLRHYGKTYSLPFLRQRCYIEKQGVSLLNMSDALESLGMRTLAVRLPLERLLEVPVPCIAHWRQNHFVVIYKVTKTKVYVADPGFGPITYTWDEFRAAWLASKMGKDEGVLLLMEPTPDFYDTEIKEDKEEARGFRFLFQYVRPYQRYLVQLGLGMLVGSLLSLVVPFLSQAMVDQGIQNQNINFVTAMIVAQIVMFFGQSMVGFIESWILLHLSVRINLSLLTDFLIKLTKLPISFFDTRTMGDIMQRMNDHSRIERFLTVSTLGVVFSLFNVFVFGAILILYNPVIFTIFIIGNALSTLWLVLFLKRRRELDFKAFSENSNTQNKLVQLIEGMMEIKLNNNEKEKRWEWEHIQAKLFRLSMKGLALDQYQSVGMSLIQQATSIFISYVTAKAVIDGQMTMGMLVAVQYIIGQIAGPLGQLVGFIHTVQDTRIAVERIGDIYNMDDEQVAEKVQHRSLPRGDKSIYLDNVTFQYGSIHSPKVLDQISLMLPEGRTTAIVGASGSGKTTLMKLLLKLYEPGEGKVHVGSMNLQDMDNRMWRDQCGTVMQDGYLFSGTVAQNIAMKAEEINPDQLLYAAHAANILEMIEALPLGFNTKIGMDGRSFSRGQMQRLLIARAIYKNPSYMFLDEATSALDSQNERIIIENMRQFFQGRTVVVIAHRLSTVRDADQIVVLDQGRIVEAGDHQALTAQRGIYYNLVKNQLELGD
jgi:ATP-binding cassette subfamily B protein